MTDKKENFYFEKPPETENFHELFLFFWNHGIGQRLKNNIPDPWNADDLQAAFEKISRDIDIRSIENWRAGKSVPHRRNLIALATIAAADDNYNRKIWAQAFIAHYQKKSQSRNNSNNSVQSRQESKSKSGLEKSKANIASLGVVLALASLAWMNFGRSDTSKLDNNDSNLQNINVQNFKNKSDNPHFDLLIEGFQSLIVDTVYQIDNTTINKGLKSKEEGSDNSSILIECDLIGLTGDFSLVCRIIDRTNQVLWSKRTKLEGPEDFNKIQSIIPDAIGDVTNILVSHDSKDRMIRVGASSLDGYLSYLKGRQNLKQWHAKRTDQRMLLAYDQLSKSISEDSDWSEPKFHMVDILHHYVSGDIMQLPGFTKKSAAEEIPYLLEQASFLANSNYQKTKAKMNAIFFSNDWVSIRSPSQEYVDTAVSRRGELEWLFEPVILLAIGEYDLVRNLVSNRILKFDPDNGTGHTYAVRSYLLEAKYNEANQRLNEANSRTFSNRLDQVRGHLLYSRGEYTNLIRHAQDSKHLSDGYREFFNILGTHSSGQPKEALKLLKHSSALSSNDVYYALAHHHLGQSKKAKELLQQISAEPLGDLEIATAIAYGAACGSSGISLPITLLEKFKQARAELPACML